MTLFIMDRNESEGLRETTPAYREQATNDFTGMKGDVLFLIVSYRLNSFFTLLLSVWIPV
jgi:hypothetical protein